MNEFLRYLKDLEYLIYIVIGGFAVWQIRNFYLAWEELRAAAFGLEKESAQMRLNRSAALLVVLLFLGIAEFGLVSFIIPSVPGVDPIPTATLNLLATPTATILVEEAETPQVLETAPVGTAVVQAGCLPDELIITFPENNSTVSGIIEIEGTVDISDFGFYKFEVSALNSENWLTIQAGDSPITDDMLGFWDTTQLEPGNYTLRLVAVDNQGIPLDPCAVDLYVEMMDE